jgi:hyaluronan synthase
MQGALDEVADEAPIDALERQFRDGVDPGVDTLFDFGSAADETDERGAVLVKSRKAALAAEAEEAGAPVSTPVAAVATATAPPRRRLNPKAGFPYLIGAAIIALEVFFIV